MLSLRHIPYGQPMWRLECAPDQPAVVALTFPGGSWQTALVSAELWGILTIQDYAAVSLSELELVWLRGQHSSRVVFGPEQLRGGGTLFRISATDEMLAVWRSDHISSSLGSSLAVSVVGEGRVRLQVIGLQLRCGTDEPAWAAPPRVRNEVEPCVWRQRYCGERQAEPFVLFQETTVAALHALDSRLQELAGFPTLPQPVWYRLVTILESLPMLQRENL